MADYVADYLKESRPRWSATHAANCRQRFWTISPSASNGSPPSISKPTLTILIRRYTVSNFTFESSGRSYIGLFGYVGSGGQIRDLGLIDGNIAAGDSDYIGGLAGYNQGGITNCPIAGSGGGHEYSAGLAGLNSGSITNCYPAPCKKPFL